MARSFKHFDVPEVIGKSENHGTQIAGGRWEDHPATRDAVMQ
jgi:hypothetical protein